MSDNILGGIVIVAAIVAAVWWHKRGKPARDAKPAPAWPGEDKPEVPEFCRRNGHRFQPAFAVKDEPLYGTYVCPGCGTTTKILPPPAVPEVRA